MEKQMLADRHRDVVSTAMSGSADILKEHPNLVNFSLGDPDITTHDSIINKAFEDAKAGHTHYTNFYGDFELIREITKFYEEEYDFKIEEDQVFISTSACHGMWLALEACLNPGDEVIVPEPFFTPYPEQVKLCGGKPVSLPTYEKDDFQIDPELLRKSITEKTRAIIVNTPNNPTGACLSKERLIEIGEIAKEHNLVIIADDIYTLLSYDQEFVPLNTLKDFFDHTITLRSFSKDYAMTGWRIGYIVAPHYVIKAIKDINENNVFTAPSISQRAALFALQNRNEIQKPIIEEYRARTMHAYERINQLDNMSIAKPRGTFYLFPNIKATGLSSEEVADRLLKEAQVLVLPGTAFGESGEGYIRLAVTVDIDAIDEAFDRIEQMSIFNNGGEK
ncbi:MAG TPA: pyridoxal phosphate-dependent aminotransferase [Alloiococcus sp.]|nr:pyridoxal phosphate-dependent aminotransferase [Alloiococcus sp.]